MECVLRVFPLTSEWLKNSQTPPLPEERIGAGDGAAPPEETKLQCLLSNYCSSLNLLMVSDSSESCLPLLFQCAVSYGSEGNRVLFIRHQPLNEIPIGVHGMPQPEASVLKNVKFLYHKNARELVSYCANIHIQTSPLPDVIIVDNLEHFIHDPKDSSPEQALTKLCCILIDTVSFIRQKGGKSVPLVISTDNNVKSMAHIIWRLPIQTASIEDLSETAALRTYRLIMTIKQNTFMANYEVKDKQIFLSGSDVLLEQTNKDESA